MTEPREFLTAMADIRQRFDDMNRVEEACGLPRLEDADLTWTERVLELERRVIVLGTWAKDRANLDAMDAVLSTIGATVLTMKIAVGRAQEARVESGS
jgi:hypothetical protein